MQNSDEPTERGIQAPSRATIVLVVFLGIGAFFLVTEHAAHVFGVLPYVLLLLCVGMHLFMHGGHGHDHGTSATIDAHQPGEGQK